MPNETQRIKPWICIELPRSSPEEHEEVLQKFLYWADPENYTVAIHIRGCNAIEDGGTNPFKVRGENVGYWKVGIFHNYERSPFSNGILLWDHSYRCDREEQTHRTAEAFEEFLRSEDMRFRRFQMRADSREAELVSSNNWEPA